MTPPPERQLVTAEMVLSAMKEMASRRYTIGHGKKNEWLAKELSAALRPVIEGEIARARLEEAKWWRHEFDPEWKHEWIDDIPCGSAWCKRVAELSREAGQ